MAKHKPSSTKDAKEAEVRTVIKDNTLNILPVWTTVYVPYIRIEDDIYEVRECVIESIGDIIDEESGVLTIFYKTQFTWDSSDEGITLNILANVSTSYEEAEGELDEFLNKQIEALKNHTSDLEKQLEKNAKHIEMFDAKVSRKWN